MSAVGFVSIVQHESFTDKAIIPTKNDRPTVGFGSTYHEDGTPVKVGDTISPERALIKAQAHIGKEEKIFRESLDGAALYQAEFDVYMDWVYQYGTPAWIKSSMRKEILAGNYVAACDALLLYRHSGGFDCSIPNNKVCSGVWLRQQKRHKTCMDAQ